MKKETSGSLPKVIFLTIITFGVYGAYWVMKNLYTDCDPEASEEEKNADAAKRATSTIFFMDRFR